MSRLKCYFNKTEIFSLKKKSSIYRLVNIGHFCVLNGQNSVLYLYDGHLFDATRGWLHYVEISV